MIVELGHFALILAFAVSIFQAVVPMVGPAIGVRVQLVVVNIRMGCTSC